MTSDPSSARNTRQLCPGLFVQPPGHHVSGWRLTENPGSSVDIDRLMGIAKETEKGKFDMFFVDNAPATNVYRLPPTMARLELLTLLSALVVQTRYIGLAATASTTFSDPFNLTRGFSSLDHTSHGRAVWNVVTSFSAGVVHNFSRDGMSIHVERYAVAHEFLEATLELWEGWQEGVVQSNKASGQCFVNEKTQPVNHQDRYFQVQGPLNTTRSPQGRPVIIKTGSFADGQKLAAVTAKVVFTAAATLEETQTSYCAQEQQAIEAGRNPDHVLILPGIMPIVGRMLEEAHKIWRELNSSVDIDSGIRQLSTRLSIDLGASPLDGSMPDMPAGEGNQSRVKLLTDLAYRENLTLRELAATAAGPRRHHVLVGTADVIANDFQYWLEKGEADGFNIMSVMILEQLSSLVKLVTPELHCHGLSREGYELSMLRKNLGLPEPDFSHQL